MNNSVSIKRIGLLYKHYYFLNRNKLLLILAATAGLIIGFHTVVHITNYRYLEKTGFQFEFHQSSFLIALLGACLLWCGGAFPAFRSKEFMMNYLMTPTATVEKFIFEFVNKILLFVIAFPIIYWVSTNLVTGMFHSFKPAYENYLFSSEKLIPRGIDNLEIGLVMSLGILLAVLTFTGASYFQKLPQVKTIVSVSLIVLLFVGYIFLVVDGLDLDEYRPKNNRILFMRNETDAKIVGIIAAIAANIILLVISYFKVREKEV